MIGATDLPYRSDAGLADVSRPNDQQLSSLVAQLPPHTFESRSSGVRIHDWPPLPEGMELQRLPSSRPLSEVHQSI